MAKFELQPGRTGWSERKVAAAYCSLLDGLSFGFDMDNAWVPAVLESFCSPFTEGVLETVSQMQRTGKLRAIPEGGVDAVVGSALRAYEYSGLRIDPGIVTVAGTVAGYDQEQLRTLLLPTDTLLREIPGAIDDVYRYKHYRRLGAEALWDMGYERMLEDEKYLPITQP
ncbi:MAG: hypothetical protein JWM81_122 [Candidatus Saccharibacteria bacterium]|nr:hypothetical protein [Candidatus Saccharibacteria bacterium]